MAGHDYITASEHKKYTPQDDWSLCGDGKTVNDGAVKGAVHDFANKYNLRIFTTSQDGPWYTWILSRKDMHPTQTSKSKGHDHVHNVDHTSGNVTPP